MTQTLRRDGRERWAYAADRVGGMLEPASRWLPLDIGRRAPLGSDVLNRAALVYEPEPYAGNAVLLQPVERPTVLDYRAGWSEVVRGRFAAYDLPGDHTTILRQPLVRHLGATLGACLARAQGGQQTEAEAAT
jgi:hypothetical protein